MAGRVTPGRPEAGPLLSRTRFAAIWAVVAVVFIAQAVASATVQNRPISWQWDVIHELIYWGLWAAASILVVRQGRRHWLEAGAGAGRWLPHLATAAVTAPVQVTVTYLIHGLGLVALGMIGLDSFPGWMEARGRPILLLSFTGFLYYWVILGVFHALEYRRLYLTERAEAAEAALAGLRAQLQPHFLFNTLNSVAVLIREQPAAAAAVVARLSELLRRVLRQDPSHEIPLASELAIVEGYLEIQRTRFEERLRVAVTIDPETRAAMVPELVLQPLVENAIHHAVEPRVEGGSITIAARRAGDRLVLAVSDDGPGLGGAHAGRNGSSVGVANTRARLRRLYGAAQDLVLEPGPGGGVVATVTLPFRTDGSAP